MSRTAIRLDHVPKPSHAEWQRLGREIDSGLVTTLDSLTDEEWHAPTECPPWTVKDVIAHVIGWEEATVSPRSLARQSIAGWKTRSSHGGMWLDATNQFQVDSMASLSPAKVVARFKGLANSYHKARGRFGLMTGIFPMKEPFSGTWVPVRFLFDTIFVRDHFMHHIDICTALGREVPLGDAERRVAHDAFREWGEKTNANVTLELSGPAGGTFVRGPGHTTIRGDAIDLCRVLAGRRCDNFQIEGDTAAAQQWLKVLAAF